MRRVAILALCFSIGHNSAMASSGRFSAELAPSYVTNRIYSRMQPLPYDRGGTIRLHFGGAYHFLLQEHSALSFGLSYALGHIELAQDTPRSVPPIYEGYALRYIWIPILARFYTGEVMIDTSIYFKLGIIPSINLPSRPLTPLPPGASTFLTERPLGFFILLGGGVKYDFSLTSSFAFGLSYCWDLPGVMYKKDPNNGEKVCYCHNNFFCFDFCCLF